METISAYEAGFLLSGSAAPEPHEDFSDSPERSLRENHGFEIPSDVFYEGKKCLFPIPEALKLVRAPFQRSWEKYLEVIIDVEGDDSISIWDRRMRGYYQWRYEPVALSWAQRATFSDMIRAIQAEALPCIERGFLPETADFEITGHSVQLLLDTKIRIDALYAYSPDLAKFARPTETLPECLPEPVTDKAETTGAGQSEKTLPGTCTGTIREIDLTTYMLTYKGIPSQVSGKGAPIIRMLLLTPHRDIPVSDFTASGTGDNTDMLGKIEKIHLTRKDKADYQKCVTELLEAIEDMEARLNEADEIGKKDEIEKSLVFKNNLLKEMKGILREDNGWIDDLGVVRYRGKIDRDGGTNIYKKKKEYKNQVDGIRSLVKATVGRVKDFELKDHLINSFIYGAKLRYAPTEPVEWETVK